MLETLGMAYSPALSSFTHPTIIAFKHLFTISVQRMNIVLQLTKPSPNHLLEQGVQGTPGEMEVLCLMEQYL